jgi:hypothetical protein
MYLAFFFYLLGAIFGFLQQNLQFVDNWWKERVMLSLVLFSIPIGYFYLKSWTYFVETLGSVWAAKFVFFGLSYITFPVLAYMFLGETPWSLKTIVSFFLSLLIIIVQYKL